jgi:hypothetical protein
VVERGWAELQQALRDLPHEGYAHVYVVRPGAEGAAPAGTGIDQTSAPRQLAG